MKRKIIILLFFCSIFISCTDSENAKRVLSSQGYTNIEITGYTFFGCGKDDFKHTGFTATSSTGQSIDGVVCQGLFFKGATIRVK